MRITNRRRPLTFEQMEQRLALSATPVNEYLSFHELDLSGVYLQAADKMAGGDITVEAVLNWTNRNTNLSSLDSGFVDIRDGEIIFHGPSFSQPDFEDSYKSSEAGSLVTPIPQPQIGKGEIAQGLIAVAEIFRPSQPLLATQLKQPRVENKAVETVVTRPTDDTWKSMSLSRGRDMYFEVAALSEGHETNGGSGDADLSSKIAPLIYQQTLQRREAERAAATTSQEPLNTQRPVAPLPAVPQQQSQPNNSKHFETPASDPEVEKNHRTAQDGDLPQADEVSQVDDPRDHVFAVWNDGDELSDEAIALRTENQQSRSATWPVLAALAATGWIARNRRSTGVLPRHRLPLRRKS